jgi:hypothetical protein
MGFVYRDLSLKGTNPNLVQFTSDCFGPRFDAAKWEIELAKGGKLRKPLLEYGFVAFIADNNHQIELKMMNDATIMVFDTDTEEEEVEISYYGLFEYSNIEQCLDIIAKDAKEAGEDAEEPAFKRLLV